MFHCLFRYVCLVAASGDITFEANKKLMQAISPAGAHSAFGHKSMCSGTGTSMNERTPASCEFDMQQNALDSCCTCLSIEEFFTLATVISLRCSLLSHTLEKENYTKNTKFVLGCYLPDLE